MDYTTKILKQTLEDKHDYLCYVPFDIRNRINKHHVEHGKVSSSSVDLIFNYLDIINYFVDEKGMDFTAPHVKEYLKKLLVRLQDPQVIDNFNTTGTIHNIELPDGTVRTISTVPTSQYETDTIA